MKKLVEKADPAEVLKEYPIADLVDGWYFRVEETSSGVYEVAGRDLWGREISTTGTDPDELLAKCRATARASSSQGAPGT